MARSARDRRWRRGLIRGSLTAIPAWLVSTAACCGLDWTLARIPEIALVTCTAVPAVVLGLIKAAQFGVFPTTIVGEADPVREIVRLLFAFMALFATAFCVAVTVELLFERTMHGVVVLAACALSFSVACLWSVKTDRYQRCSAPPQSRFES